MEPFVPKPEERISHQNNGGTKSRATAKTPKRESAGNPLKFFSHHLHIIVPSIIFSLLLAVLYSVQQQSIASIEKQMATMSAKDAKAASTPQDKSSTPATATPDDSVNSDSPQLTKEIAALNKQLASQAAKLQGLEKQVQSLQLSANGETPAGRQNQAAIAGLKSDVISLQKAFDNTAAKTAAELTKYSQWQKSLENNIDKRMDQQTLTNQTFSAQLSDFDKKIGDLNGIFEKNLAAVRADWSKELASSAIKISAIEQQTSSVPSLEQALVSLRTELTTLSENQNQLSANDEATESQLAELKNQLKITRESSDGLLAGDQLQAALAPLKERVENLAATSGEISAELDGIKSQQSQLNEKLTINEGELDSLAKTLNAQTEAPPPLAKAELETAILPLRQEIANLGNTLQASSSGLSAQKTNLNRLRDEIAVQLVAIIRDQKQLATALATNENQLADASRMAAAHKDAAEPLAKAEFEATIRPLKQQLETIDSNLDKAISKIGAQEKDFTRLRSQLETQLAQQQNIASDPDSNALNAIDAQLASQMEALNALRSKDNQLYAELSQALKDLKNLQGKMAQLSTATAAAPSPVLSVDIAALNERVRDLSSRFDNTVSTLANNDSKITRWQEDMELKLASQPPGGAGGQDLQTVKEIIQLLMKQHPYTKFPAIN
ncbi:MAG: hypothetical protein M0Q95_02530 [Porticoccaceae bacterium]|nr:hypothetical protein [Porticoccaceae bacterium]